jgi:hypothetical protein
MMNMSFPKKYVKLICFTILLCAIIALPSCKSPQTSLPSMPPVATPDIVEPAEVAKSTAPAAETPSLEIAEAPEISEVPGITEAPEISQVPGITLTPVIENPTTTADYQAFIIDSCLIGAWYGHRWLDAAGVYSMLPDEGPYNIYLQNGQIMSGIGRKSNGKTSALNGEVIMDAIHWDKPMYQDYLAISGNAELSILYPEKADAGNPIFQGWVNQVCAENGYPNLKLSVHKAYFVDSEVWGKIYFIIADNEQAEGQKGFIQFIRITVDGKEKSMVIEKDFRASASRRYDTELRYICDLSYDGIPEFITCKQGFGDTVWGMYTVYSIPGEEYVEVLSAGWFGPKY